MSKQEARLHSLDLPRVISVEYPLNIKNVDKAVAMTGGARAIAELAKTQEPLELRLRPGDKYQHPIEGKMTHTDNILMKISVLKKILHEKYHGNLQAYIDDHRQQKDQPLYLKTEPVAIINKTYRFREMSDYQYITKNSKSAQEVAGSVLTGDLEKILSLDISIDEYPWSANNKPRKDEDLDLPPPPIFSSMKVPAFYGYQQNEKNFARVSKSGVTKLVPTNKARRLRAAIMAWDCPEVPSSPDIALIREWEEWASLVVQVIERIKHVSNYEDDFDLDDIFPHSKPLQFHSEKIPQTFHNELLRDQETSFAYKNLMTIEHLQKMFEKHPIYLRRQLLLLLPKYLKRSLKTGLPFVSYLFRKGPWRMMCIKMGVDPRKDQRYRMYQNESFRVVGVSSGTLLKEDEDSDNEDEDSNSTNSQMFEFWGDKFPKSLSILVKDLHDPDVVEIFDLNKDLPLNKVPNESFGWYNPRILIAIRRLIRFKLPYLYKNKKIPEERIRLIIEASLQDVDFDSRAGDKGAGDGEFADDADSDEEYFDFNALIQEGNEEELLQSLMKSNPKYAEEVKKLVGFIKQEDLDLQ